MFPEIVDVEFSPYCNLKCGFCFGPVDDRTIPNLPTEFWIQTLTRLKEYGAKGIVVSGGEPTIHKDIITLLSHAKSLELSVVMSTHGQIRKKVLECAEFTDWIALPVDGITKDVLRKMRGRPWGLNDAHNLIETLKSLHPNIRIKLGTVASCQNLHEIPEIGKLALKLGTQIDTWKIYQYTARRKFKDRWREFHLPDKHYSALRTRIQKDFSNPPFGIVFSSNASRRRAYLFIYPDGTAAVPNVGEKMKDFVFGNLYREGKTVLDRVSGLSWKNHIKNYHSTYHTA